MSTPLQISGRALHRHVQNALCLLSRPNSSAAPTAPSSPSKKDNTQQNNNAHIKPVFHNRNPRNLELLTIASKPEGYHLDSFEVSYWHKLLVRLSWGKISAEVVHNNGTTVVSASSGEFGIEKLLYRTADSSAYKTIGKVIARRCLESGISTVFCDYKPEEGTKMDLLLKEAQNGGLSLEEAPVYVPPLPQTKGVPTKPWDIIS
ncbi:39S ribosomal protein L18, mitochondrial isoform X2 [Thrips palmi]|nr:39S ribosomal protein L18, mitochondrial isoform X2 [Thrips palmi]XP_034236085.1 39S ribosomal protein L18, mitochondrial isoform X2 [Thrips palmi]XP_034236086.1 39S ribosomal protein L18, mitochondrial isoform X2 [Thrips palmi]